MTAPYPFKNMTESLERLCKQKDWIKYTLNQLGQKGEIGTFKYSSAGTHLLSAIITKLLENLLVNLLMSTYLNLLV